VTALWIALAVFVTISLVLVTFVQLLYLESLRLRPRERPALQYFKETLQERIGPESERGLLAFSLLKHTLLVLIGVVSILIGLRLRSGRQIGLLVESCIMAWLTMLVATYVVPHVLYRKTSGRWLRPFAPLLRGLGFVVRPLVAVSAFFQSLTEMSRGNEAEPENGNHTDNIEALIAAGSEEGLIEESDRELIQSVVAFGDKTVREVMTPRPNVIAIEASESLEALRDLAINVQYSRIPVYEGDIDNIVGFVHVRDMFELDEEERKQRLVRDLVREINFVPETKMVSDLLREFQQQRRHIAVAVDEYGNTAGLVTMEDLVEEVFGEIRDEHEPGLDIAKDLNGNYVVSGNFGVDRLEDLMEFRPAEEPASTTVGGLVMEWLGRVPRPGEAVERDGVRLEVLASNNHRVELLRVSRAEQGSHA
jgi:CBS domain containing-hemolysin-like protein